MEPAAHLSTQRRRPYIPEPPRAKPVRPVEADTTVIAPAHADAMRTIESTYTLRHRDRLLPFLESNMHLVPILLDLPAAVRTAFGSEMPIALDFVTDGRPGMDDDIIASTNTYYRCISQDRHQVHFFQQKPEERQ